MNLNFGKLFNLPEDHPMRRAVEAKMAELSDGDPVKQHFEMHAKAERAAGAAAEKGRDELNQRMFAFVQQLDADLRVDEMEKWQVIAAAVRCQDSVEDATDPEAGGFSATLVPDIYELVADLLRTKAASLRRAVSAMDEAGF